MTPAEDDLARTAAAWLRTVPAEHRGAVLDGIVRDHKATLARLRRDMLPAELARRATAFRGAIEAAIGNG